MKNYLHNNRVTVFIVIIAIGSISGVVTAQFVMGQDGANTQKNLLGGCIYGACQNTTISEGSSGGAQPTPTEGKLTVIKKVNCGAVVCATIEPSDFTITVTGNNPSPESFKGSETGTKVTLGPSDYRISETPPPTNGFIFGNDFSGNCHRLDATGDATGSIEAGETQECTITNTFNP